MQLCVPSAYPLHAQFKHAKQLPHPCTHPIRTQTRTATKPCTREVTAQAAADSVEPGRLLIFGLGYTSLGVANLCAAKGWHVSCTMRSPKSAVQLSRLKPGWQPLIFDPCSQPGVLGDQLQDMLHDSTHVLTTIPPVALPLYDPVLQAQLKALKKVQPQNLRWLGYVSSTSVYGDHQGNWVDETSECRAAASRGYVRHQHELAWVAAAHDKQLAAPLPLHIFRAGGIYGPERSLITSSRSSSGAGTAAPSNQGVQSDETGSKDRRAAQQYISRVHVYDLCQAIIASMQRPSSSSAELLVGPEACGAPELLKRGAGVYNIVDDEPAPRSEVSNYLRALQQGREQHQSTGGSEDPTSQQATVANREVSVALEEKRVKNSKAKKELGLVLKYPTYREGMSALLAGDLSPFTAEDLAWLGFDACV